MSNISMPKTGLGVGWNLGAKKTHCRSNALGEQAHESANWFLQAESGRCFIHYLRIPRNEAGHADFG